MVIDSGLITGSLSVSGSYTQTGNAVISGSLTVTGNVNATITGSITTASYALRAETLDGLDSTVFTLTSSFQNYTSSANTRLSALEAASASLNSYTASTDAKITSINAFSASVLNYTSSTDAKLTALYAFSSSLLSYTSSTDAKITSLNAATASLNSYTSSTDAKIASIYTTTASLNAAVSSLNSYTSSTDAKIASIYTTTASLNASVAGLNLQSASLLSYTSSTDAKIASIYNATSSLQAATASLYTATASFSAKVGSLEAQSASLLSYTSSTDAKIASIYTTTASLNASVASLNSYTSSNTMNIASLFATSASLNANVAGLNAQTASLLSYTSSNNTTNTSQNTRLSALEAATASLYTTTASLNASVAGLNTQTASLNASVAGLNSYTASQNILNGKYATTGSNTFTGKQYISDASQANSFTQTASLYTDGGLRVSKDAYVSGTLYLNNLTVFGTQSVAYISSSQLNIATNIISVNTSTPSVRFGGLAVQDSGSGATGLTGSILWDSQDNQWIYSNPSGSTYDSAVFLVGPRSSGALGSEVGITTNALSKGDGLHHMTSSVVFDVSGSVGIGTSSPAYKLHIVSATGTIARFDGSGVAANSATEIDVLGPQSNGEINLGVGGSTFTDSTNNIQNKAFITAGSGLSGLNLRSDAGYVQITAGGVAASNEVARFTSGGNVGIGTSSPSQLVEAYQSANADVVYQITNPNTNSAATAQFFASNGTTRTQFYHTGTSYGTLGAIVASQGGIYTTAAAGLAIVAANASGIIKFATGGTTERVRIAADGNVGIGTTSPGQALDVNGKIRLRDGGNTTVPSIQMNAGGTMGFSNPSNEDISIITVSTTRVFVKGTDGNVGIGTTTTPTKLTTYVGSGAISGTNDAIRLQVSGYDDAARNTIVWGQDSSNLVLARFGLEWNLSTSQMNFVWRDMYNSTVGSTELMRLTGGGNLGIGTSSPGALLSVGAGTGNPNGTQFRTVIRGTSSRTLYLDSDSGGASMWWGNGSTPHFAIDSAVGGGAAFWTHTSGAWSSRMTINSDGNVGIGTTSPSRKLHVVGSEWDNTSGGGVIFENSNAVGASLTLKPSASTVTNGTSGWAVYAGGPGAAIGDGNIGFWAHGTNEARFVIQRGGNVGIGTTDPNRKLHVRSTDDTRGILIHNTSTTSYAELHFSASREYRIGTGGSSSDSAAANNWYVYDLTAGTHRFTINSSGNVGIGTTSPAYALDVVGIGKFSSYVATNSNYYLSSGGFIHFDWGVSNDYYIRKNSTALTFNTAGTFVFQGGNVGIGTTSPSGRLHIAVDGAAVWSQYFTATNGANKRNSIGFYDSGGTNIAAILTDVNADGTADFGISVPNGSPRLVIKASGNVGIGISSPTNLLHTAGASATPSLRLGSVSAGYHWDIGRENQTTGDFVFNNANGGSSSERMRITVGGNVGIGTSSPSFRLDVQGGLANFGQTASVGSSFRWGSYGTAVSPDTMLCMNQLWNGSGWTILNSSYGTTAINLGSAEASPTIRFETGGANTQATTKMIILNNGNVGIGTTSVPSTLVVYNDSDVWHARIGGASGELRIGGQTASGAVIQAYTPGGSVRDLYIQRDGGSVGIGTFSPSAKLDVRGRQFVGGGTSAYVPTAGSSLIAREAGDTFIGVHDAGYGVMMMGWDRSEDRGTIAVDSSQDIVFITDMATVDGADNLSGKTPKVIIKGGGNVGIGATSPTGLLEVYKSTSGGLGGHIILNNNGSAVGNETAIIFQDGGVGDVRAAISSTVEGAPYLGDIKFKTGLTSYGSLSTRMIITGAGNVGIGTTSPGAKLDVRGNSLFYNSSADTYLRIQGNSSYDAVLELKSDQGGIASEGFQMWYVNNVGDVHFATTYNNDAASMHFYTRTGGDKSTSNERLTILGGGNVGIGSSSPGTKLDVNGIASFRGSTNSVDSARFYNTDGNYAYIRTTEASNTNNTWFDATLGATIWLGWDNPGQARTSNTFSQVYIGTGRGTLNETVLLRRGDIEGKDGSGTTNYRIVATGALGSHTYFNYGNVGIGTTSPGSLLHVNGRSYIGTMTSYAPAVHIRGAYYGGPRLQVYGLDADANGWMGLGTDMSSAPYELSVYYSTNGASSVCFGKYDGTASQYGGFTPTARLSNAGTWTVAGDVVAYGSPSDITLKTNVKPLEGALEKVTKLQGVSFTWKENTEMSKMTNLKDDIGFIAQEVQEILPDLVRKNDNGLLSLRDKGITALLVEAIKEQQQQIDELKYLLQTINK
jgi:septal ring factor EnvC (AmiA/AmiB activator)